MKKRKRYYSLSIPKNSPYSGLSSYIVMRKVNKYLTFIDSTFDIDFDIFIGYRIIINDSKLLLVEFILEYFFNFHLKEYNV